MIRRARAEDVDGIAAVHVAAWQAAYPGILPAHTLEAFTLAERRRFWSGVAPGEPVPGRPVLVAVESEAVVGFAVCGPPRDHDMPFDAELFVLNVQPARWRRGIGRRLFACCVDQLSDLGHSSFYLWVLTANERARRFYESVQGKPLAEHIRDADFGGVGVPEIAYGWAKLPDVASVRDRD
ncbi:MAG TPA: GNAT family N-acetyltransferase [Candidatus Acidoferrum sp.]|nr:GNAT family N-acetyltransferase [Candidatus Acidoferrum sp.]